MPVIRNLLYYLLFYDNQNNNYCIFFHHAEATKNWCIILCVWLIYLYLSLSLPFLLFQYSQPTFQFHLSTFQTPKGN